ncbi:hypothetical protein V7S43_003064 [Phytophthora oleae]|uniref:Uncharacterized protein n=1 Tax=Phytophthora oleae TaxID=2107226 RepID=A0ABD3G5E7_9STRA
METSSDFLEESRRRSEEELQSSNNSDDHAQSAQEQLAELQLLARASSVTSPSIETATLEEEFDNLLNEDEPRGRFRVATGGPSTFTAILAASRKIATISADHTPNDHESEEGIPVIPLDQAQEALTVEIPGRPRSPKAAGKSLPTLNEGAEGEEDDDEAIPETTSIVTSTSFVSKLSSSRVDIVPAPAIQEQETPVTCQELEEPNTDDVEFVEMLEHLSRGKLDFLALTLDDLTARKLKRVHAALRKAQAPVTMPFVRTLVSLDMLQLLSRRLGVQPVRGAVSRAMQHASESEENASGLASIALLTSCNIAAVLLEARQELTTAEANMVLPPASQRTSPVSGIKRRSSQTSLRSSSSPCSSMSSSPRCGTPRSPAVDRRSILAKEGVHVLMQEKLTSYDHRGQANALPAFRVRGASASLTDSAAKRRQRGLQYANEHISHRTVHM